jgi:SAM-dependent methyltransferase
MRKFNLIQSPEKVFRNTRLRRKNKEQNRIHALKFGQEYFDGTRAQGYGGYIYDGRWVSVAERLIKRYQLSAGSNFLDVGCAKGFLMHDVSSACPGINVKGIDVSEYAKATAWGEMGALIDIGSCVSLPYPDNYFDASVAINSIHNVSEDDCVRALNELMRVTKNKRNIFVQVDAFSNKDELRLFEEWMLTAQTYKKPSEWKKLLNSVGFQGDYFWTILGFNDQAIK